MAPTEKDVNRPLVAGDGFKQIGSTLKDARRSQGRTIREISEQLRISVDFLTKLESGAFSELPAPAYVIGFLRSYGRCVGLAPDPLVARYKAVTEGEASKPSYKTPMSTRPPQRSAPAVASMLVLLAFMAYGGWFWLKTNSLPASNSVETDTKTAEFPRSLDHGDDSIDLTSLDRPAKIDLRVDDLADTLDVSTAVSSKEKITKLSGSGPDTSKNQGTDFPALELAPNNKAPNSGSLDLLNGNRAIAKLRDPAKEITIQAVAASWVEIVRDNGEEVLAKLMQAGDYYVVEGNTRLFLTTGNAGGLRVVIGTDDPLSIGDIGEIVRDLPLVTDELRKSL